MTEEAAFTWALYQSSWLPCRVLAEDPQTGTLEVRLTDRSGTHEVWPRPEHVRGHARGSLDGAAMLAAAVRYASKAAEDIAN